MYLSKFRLSHPDPTLFVTSQWQSDPYSISSSYLLYRILSACTLVTLQVGHYNSLGPYQGHYGTFLTSWCFSFIVALHLFDVVNVIWAKANEIYPQSYSSSINSLNCIGRISWFWSNVASAPAAVVALVYW